MSVGSTHHLEMVFVWKQNYILVDEYFFFCCTWIVNSAEKMAWLHTLIMVGGGLYLCWMGYQMLRGALKKEAVSAPAPQIELAKSGRSFLKGLLTNLANPKAIIYFGSVFSLFVGDNVGTTARWGIFALIIVETLAWFTVVASLFALPQMRRGYQRLAKWIDGFAGALFAGFGIHLIISR